MRIVKLLFTVFLCIDQTSSFSCIERKVNFIPSTLETSGLTQSYKVTLMNKLFSSVPKREFAIEKVSLAFGDGPNANPTRRNNFSIIKGSSGCGKSTYLRLVSGTESPKLGSVKLNNCNIYDTTNEALSKIPKPVIVDSKLDCYNDKASVIDQIQSSCPSKVGLDIISKSFASILGLSDEELQSLPRDLSPSAQYLFGIVCACVESSYDTIQSNDDTIELQSPILLLDELADFETSIVARKVGHGLSNLADNGAIILCATHKPDFYREYADRVITFSLGRVLTDEQLNR